MLDRDPTHAKVLQQLGWLHHQQSNSFTSQESAIEYLEKSVSSGKIRQNDLSHISSAYTWQIKAMHRVGIFLVDVTCHNRNIPRHTRHISKQSTETGGIRLSGARLAFCITRLTSTEMRLMRTPGRYA